MNTFDQGLEYSKSWKEGTRLIMRYVYPPFNRGGLQATFIKWVACGPRESCCKVCRTNLACFVAKEGVRRCGGKKEEWYWEEVE